MRSENIKVLAVNFKVSINLQGFESSTRALAASCSYSISTDGALQPSFCKNVNMSLLEFSANVGVNVPSTDSSSVFHSIYTVNSLLVYSHETLSLRRYYQGIWKNPGCCSAMSLGLMPFSLVYGTVILISFSHTASSRKHVTLCLGGFPLHFFCNKATCLFSSAQFFTPFEIYFAELEAIISVQIFLANESPTDLETQSLLLQSLWRLASWLLHFIIF